MTFQKLLEVVVMVCTLRRAVITCMFVFLYCELLLVHCGWWMVCMSGERVGGCCVYV